MCEGVAWELVGWKCWKTWEVYAKVFARRQLFVHIQMVWGEFQQWFHAITQAKCRFEQGFHEKTRWDYRCVAQKTQGTQRWSSEDQRGQVWRLEASLSVELHQESGPSIFLFQKGAKRSASQQKATWRVEVNLKHTFVKEEWMLAERRKFSHRRILQHLCLV